MTGGGLLWYGRLQLLFRCTLCPTGARDRSLYREVSLAFFSTFEPVELTPDSIMQRQGVPMLYDSASCSALPSLYICHVKNILGRVPMIPCFVEGNSQPTIPHSFRRHELAGGAADTRPDTGPTAATAAACMRYLRHRSTVCGRLLGQPSALSRFAGCRPRLANALCPFLHGLQDGHLALMSPTVAPHPQIDHIAMRARKVELNFHSICKFNGAAAPKRQYCL